MLYMEAQTREPQYQITLDIKNRQGLTPLGLMTNQTWHDDPRRLTFVLARYKFVAKMLSGKNRVLEVGCADAFGTRIVQQEVGQVTAIDFDPVFIEDVHQRMEERWQFEAFIHDILEGPVPGTFEAAFCMDVLEHIQPTDEHRFIANIAASLTEHGVLIAGSPSLESQAYASPASKAGHVNCKSAPQLKALMEEYFHNVFIFSMNDEVVHTGYYAMSHYLLAMGCGKKIKRLPEGR